MKCEAKLSRPHPRRRLVSLSGRVPQLRCGRGGSIRGSPARPLGRSPPPAGHPVLSCIVTSLWYAKELRSGPPQKQGGARSPPPVDPPVAIENVRPEMAAGAFTGRYLIDETTTCSSACIIVVRSHHCQICMVRSDIVRSALSEN